MKRKKTARYILVRIRKGYRPTYNGAHFVLKIPLLLICVFLRHCFMARMELGLLTAENVFVNEKVLASEKRRIAQSCSGGRSSGTADY